MLYEFLYSLRDIFAPFNIFKYITFRAAGAALTSFVLCLLLGPYLIRKLTLLKIGERVRPENEWTADMHKLHSAKEGTPTMGGIIIIISVLLSLLLWADLFNKYILLIFVVFLWLGLLGFKDDFLKLSSSKSRGLSIKKKLFFQVLLGLVIGGILYLDKDFDSRLDIPFLKKIVIDLSPWYIIFCVLVIVGSSNSVNLTDGLDGLAVGSLIMLALSFSVLCYVSGHSYFSNYLLIPYIKQGGELTVFCGSLVGALLGFLWFNCYPASIFMGDVGALSLGGAIGATAVFIKKELLLVLVGGVFVIEALSVMLQVGSFRFRKGKRIFKMAPLHHHYQVKGLHESKVIVRFWIVAAILALLTLTTLKIR